MLFRSVSQSRYANYTPTSTPTSTSTPTNTPTPTPTVASTDTTPPSLSNYYVSTASDQTSVSLTWTKATDAVSAQSSLVYEVYYSTSYYYLLSDIQTNANKFGSGSADINSTTVTGLSQNTSYYFYVTVKDEAGNTTQYSYATDFTAKKCQWIGVTSSNWSTATNWSNCGSGAPGANDDVFIPGDASTPPIVNSSTTVRSIAGSSGGGEITISSGVTLTINGSYIKSSVAIKGTSGSTTYRDWETDRKSARLNSSHEIPSRMPSSA